MTKGVDISITVNGKPLWDWLPVVNIGDGWLMFYWLRFHIGISVRRWE